MLHIHHLMDNPKCDEEVRRLRWPYGVRCPPCESNQIAKRGRHHRHQECRRYRCKKGGRPFDELTETIFAGHHQPLRVWIRCWYRMGLNWSNRQIAHALDLNDSDVPEMASWRRRGVVDRRPLVCWEGEGEGDEGYVIAGHQGRADGIRGRKARRNRRKGARGRGTLATEKPPIFGMIPRGGEVRIAMLENVQQRTIAPLIPTTITPGSTVHTDEYHSDERLTPWGYDQKTVGHRRGEYARDEDGDGFHEVHVNPREGFWSLLRSWRRPQRGISQEKLPLYLGFFAFVHHAKRREKALLGSLMGLLLQPTIAPRNPI